MLDNGQVFDLLTDISADVRAAAVTALSKMRDKGRALRGVGRGPSQGTGHAAVPA